MNSHGKDKKKAAIFGGTFDPFHNGHLKIIEYVLENFNLDKIFLIPAGNQYMKPEPPKATPLQRFEMCKLAVKSHLVDLVELIEYEIQKTSPSYTFDTLAYLKKNKPDFSVQYIILGGDAFDEISLWKKSSFLRNNYKFIIIQRDKINHKQNIKTIPVLKLSDISSSNIRNKIIRKESILLDTPMEIQKYISDNYLYNDE
jgi:nicotinate-nucleotide adenylyltransferase|tara:strand:+ start:17211 stop:17810 length:600 start_codon:yes stop_codon:yes gene_type:complete